MNTIQEGQKSTEVLSVTLQRTAKYNTIFSTLDVVRIRRNWSYSPLTTYTSYTACHIAPACT